MSDQQLDKMVDEYIATKPRVKKLTPEELFQFMGWKDNDDRDNDPQTVGRLARMAGRQTLSKTSTINH